MDYGFGLWISNPTKLGLSIHVNGDYGISPYLKLGLWDYTSFEIGITGPLPSARHVPMKHTVDLWPNIIDMDLPHIRLLLETLFS